MLMCLGVPPTFLAADPASLAADLKHLFERPSVRTGTARRELAGPYADIRTIEIKADALLELLNRFLGEASVSANRACCGARVALVDTVS